MSDRLPLSRRTVLTAGALGAVSDALAAVAASAGTTPPAAPSGRAGPKARELRFRPDGTFKVVQFNDTQDDELTDRRTVELIEKVLDQEKPDFVVINGDVISGGCASRLEVKQAINNVVWPMESRRIPWAVTYGNHDEDSLPESGVDEAGMLKIYRSYDYNVNADNAAGRAQQPPRRPSLRADRERGRRVDPDACRVRARPGHRPHGERPADGAAAAGSEAGADLTLPCDECGGPRAGSRRTRDRMRWLRPPRTRPASAPRCRGSRSRTPPAAARR